MLGIWIQNLQLSGAENRTTSMYMKHFGSHPNEECRNEFSTYSTDVMFGQKFLT